MKSRVESRGHESGWLIRFIDVERFTGRAEELGDLGELRELEELGEQDLPARAHGPMRFHINDQASQKGHRFQNITNSGIWGIDNWQWVLSVSQQQKCRRFVPICERVAQICKRFSQIC